MFSNFFFFENRADYDIMAENIVELERPQAIWRMRVSCLINKATHVKAHTRGLAPTLTHACIRTDTNM